MIRCENCHERFYSPEEHHSLSGCQKKTIKSLRTKTARLEADLRAAREEAAGLRELVELARSRAMLLNQGCDDPALQDEIMDFLTQILGPLPGDAALAAAAPEPSSGGE